MKARIKYTGVLIDVIPKSNTNAQHSGDNLYVCDNMVFRECELDFLNVENSAIDWEQRRYEISKDVLSAFLSNSNEMIFEGNPEDHAKDAVVFADALIKKLREHNK